MEKLHSYNNENNVKLKISKCKHVNFIKKIITIFKYIGYFSVSSLIMIFITGYAPILKNKKVRDYIDDTVITVKIKSRIFLEQGVKSSEIHAETFNGIVQLSGFVSSKVLAERALNITRTVDGIQKIIDDIQINNVNYHENISNKFMKKGDHQYVKRYDF